MPTTTGLVQRLTVLSGPQACVWIGPTPTNTALLVVTHDNTASKIALAGSLIDTLGAAMTQRREVAAGHGTSSASITSLTIHPI